jgi:hypothetical protein
VTRRVRTASGATLEADRIVLSPGVAMRWDLVQGLAETMRDQMPHAWLGDTQVATLRRRIDALRDGATVAIVAPPNPYRCPPGPYERASLIAWHLRRGGRGRGKVLVLDAKDDFSKRPLFQLGWDTLYPGTASVASAETVTVFEGIPVDGIDTWLIPGERHSISGRISWPENTTAENVVIEYGNLTAQRSGIWTVPDPGDLFHITGVPRGTVVLLARADSNRGPLAGVVTTEVNVDEVDDLELRLGTPGAVDGRVIYDASVPSASRAEHIALKQQLLPVSPLYPTPQTTIGVDGRFQISGALGVYDVDVAGLRVVRVTQSGREIPNRRIRVGLGESISDLEVLVSK